MIMGTGHSQRSKRCLLALQWKIATQARICCSISKVCQPFQIAFRFTDMNSSKYHVRLVSLVLRKVSFLYHQSESCLITWSYVRQMDGREYDNYPELLSS